MFSLIQIKNNVAKIFSKFLQEGKATIKFKEPAHDLSISKVFKPQSVVQTFMVALCYFVHCDYWCLYEVVLD